MSAQIQFISSQITLIFINIELDPIFQIKRLEQGVNLFWRTTRDIDDVHLMK